MTCTRPIYGRYDPAVDLKVIFNPSPKDIMTKAEVIIPCGQCIHCRLEKSRQWAMRCMHEASMHEENMFLTLTYNDEHLPKNLSLNKKEIPLFLKKYRTYLERKEDGTKIRYFACGEYGDNTNRPHYHALIFGHDFKDKEYHTRTEDGENLYTSHTLDRLWKHGYGIIGDVSFQSAAYVARYQLKKITGLGASPHYGDRTPEFALMSRGKDGGIGKPWLDKWATDVYPNDYVIVNGKKMKPPKYYDAQLPEDFLKALKENRIENSPEISDQQLHAKEVIAEQKQKLIERMF